MSRVIVKDRDGNGHNYPDTTGANYDAQGFLTIVTGYGEDAQPVAVWAPGFWSTADLIRDGGPSDTQEVPTP